MPRVVPHSSSYPIILAALLTLAPSGGCQGKGDAEGSPAASGAAVPQGMIGQTAPTLAGKTTHGERLALSDLRGKVVLVNVWATWCKPCTRELPELARLHRMRGPDGFSVLGVSIDKRQMLAKVRSFEQSYRLGYPTIFDPEGRAIADWNVHGYPTSVLIGRDGTVRWRRDGMIHTDDAELAKQLDAALAEAAP